MKKLLLLLASMSFAGSVLVFGQADIVKINKWLVAGSFTAAQTTDLLGYPFLDESAATPMEGAKAGDVQWKKLTTPFIDFTKQGYAKTEKCAAYAFTYVYAPSDRLAVIRFGSDDGAIIWLNGVRVLEQRIKRSLVENQDTVFIQLGKGWNRLLIKVDQGGGGWEMVCSLSATDITVSQDRPDPENLAKSPEAAITHIGISKTDKEKATLSVTVSNYASADLSDIRCELTGALVTPAKAGAPSHSTEAGSVIPAKAGAPSRYTEVFNLELPLLKLCGLLSKPGARVRIMSSAGINEVAVEPETATELLMKVAAMPDLADTEMQKSASAIASAIRIYGITTDFSGQARAALERIAANRLPEVKPILDEIAARIVANVPDLRGDSIYVTGHAHMDMNWLWPYNESVKMFHDNFRQVIAFMERFPDYRMLQSQATIYQHIEQMDPPLFDKVKKYVAEGRLELAGGMWTEGDCNLTGGEALCRSFLLGQRYFLDRFGKMARVGWLPDNFGHISQFPQLLKLAGCDYYYFHRCVPFIGPFWWTGPDSTKVLCFTNYTYNGEITPGLKNEVARISPVTHKMLHPTGIGDHGGGPTLKNIEMIHQLDATPRFPSIKFASAESFFEATEKMPVSLPVHRGEMQFIFEGCYTSVAEIKENTRKSEQSMYAAEFLSSLRWLTGDPYPADDLKSLWETVAFNQFHDILPGSAIYETYQDAVADHKMVQKKASSIFESDFRRLSDEITFKTGAGQPVVALNLQPRSGKVLVQAEVYSHERPATAFLSSWGDYYEYAHVKPATGNRVATMMVRDGFGRSYPAQIIGGKEFPPGFRSTVEFVVDSMPAGGYKTFYADASMPGSSVEEIPEKDGLFETDFFIIRMDLKTGDIIGLIDKRTGKEYVSANGRLNRLRIWMEAPNGMNAWTIGETKEIADITDIVSVAITERGPVRATVEVVKKWGRSKFIQRTYIYKNYPRIDFDLEVHWFETGDGVNPAPFLKATFDLAMDNPLFYSQVPFDVVSRPVNGQEVPAQQWVDVSDGKDGMALLNRTKFGHSYDKGQLRLSLLRATYSPDLYPNMGINHIQYSLFPHTGDWKNGVWAEGENFNVPVYAAEPPSLALAKTHSTRPENGSLLAVSPAEVVMSGIKQAEDGKNLIIRLAEVTGKETMAVITLPVRAISAIRVNIIELPLESAEKPLVDGRIVRVRLRPREIVTLSIAINP
ncbi:MAG: glycoside hydrolase family 38 C-terminal domain-containing protein [Bacteroidales bacterium]